MGFVIGIALLVLLVAKAVGGGSGPVALTPDAGVTPAPTPSVALSTPSPTTSPTPAPVKTVVVVKTVLVTPKASPTPAHHAPRTILSLKGQHYSRTTSSFKVTQPWVIKYGFGLNSARVYPPLSSSCSFQARPVDAKTGRSYEAGISDSGAAGSGEQQFNRPGTYVIKISFSCHIDPNDGYPPGSLYGGYSLSVIG